MTSIMTTTITTTTTTTTTTNTGHPGHYTQEMRKEFDFIVCDSPAGIESGARHAMYFSDDAVIVTNPELSSCRDSDKMIGFISSRWGRVGVGGRVVVVVVVVVVV